MWGCLMKKTKENHALEMYKREVDLRSFNEFIFGKHDAYRALLNYRVDVTDKAVLDSY